MLAESKALTPADSAYRRGTDYLLSTQFPDGSWHVRSRSIKFQPYFESGFPFGHDQWISTAHSVGRAGNRFGDGGGRLTAYLGAASTLIVERLST